MNRNQLLETLLSLTYFALSDQEIPWDTALVTAREVVKLTWDCDEEGNPKLSPRQKITLLEAFSILGGLMNYSYCRDETEKLASRLCDWLPELQSLHDWPRCLTQAPKAIPKHEGICNCYPCRLKRNPNAKLV